MATILAHGALSIAWGIQKYTLLNNINMTNVYPITMNSPDFISAYIRIFYGIALVISGIGFYKRKKWAHNFAVILYTILFAGIVLEIIFAEIKYIQLQQFNMGILILGIITFIFPYIMINELKKYKLE
jgi:hypothetical protein